MRYILAILLLCLTANVYAVDYMVCHDDTGNITAWAKSLVTSETCITVPKSELDNYHIREKLVSGDTLIDNPDYNKHVDISADTELLADGSSTTTITVTLQDKNDATVTDDDRTLDISTDGGRLSALTVTTVSGVGTVTFTSVTDTKKCGISVIDETGKYKTGTTIIQLTP